MDGINGTGVCQCNKGFNGTACEMCEGGKYGVHCDQGRFSWFTLHINGRFPLDSGSRLGQSAPVKTVAVMKGSPATERVSVTLAGEASSVMKV